MDVEQNYEQQIVRRVDLDRYGNTLGETGGWLCMGWLVTWVFLLWLVLPMPWILTWQVGFWLIVLPLAPAYARRLARQYNVLCNNCGRPLLKVYMRRGERLHYDRHGHPPRCEYCHLPISYSTGGGGHDRIQDAVDKR